MHKHFPFPNPNPNPTNQNKSRYRLPNERIGLVVRGDACPETQLLSAWLNASWAGWPLGVGESLDWGAYVARRAGGASQMQAELADTAYSLGYDESWAACNFSASHGGAYAEALLVNNRGNAVTSKSASYDTISWPWPAPGKGWANVSTLAMMDSDLPPLLYIAYAYVSQDLSGNGTVGAAIRQMVRVLERVARQPAPGRGVLCLSPFRLLV